MTHYTSPSFEEIASSGGHKDATFHVGGHGEPGPDVKVIVMTTRGEPTSASGAMAQSRCGRSPASGPVLKRSQQR